MSFEQARNVLSCSTNFKAHLYLEEEARAVFVKTRSVPYAL